MKQVMQRIFPGLMAMLVLGATVQAQNSVKTHVSAEGAHGADWPMFTDPLRTELPVKTEFPAGLKELWAQALGRPDEDTRRQAAEAIVEAQAKGLPELKTLAPQLRRIIRSGEGSALLKGTALDALVALDDREIVGDLLEMAKSGAMELMLRADRALAAWDVSAAREVWLARAGLESNPTPGRRSAVEALGRVREAKAGAMLRKMVGDAAAALDLRWAAAQALGEMDQVETVATARQLTGGDEFGRLCAAVMLRSNRGAEVASLALKLAQDRNAAVAAAALEALRAQGTEAMPVTLDWPAWRDVRVRRNVAQALAARKTTAAMELLVRLLADENPALRRDVREWLVELAGNNDLRATIVEAARRVLAGDGWQGLEQAAYLLSALQEKATASRLVELLPHARVEVRLAACVGLRRLAVAETLPALLARAQKLAEECKAPALQPVPGEADASKKDVKKDTKKEAKGGAKDAGKTVPATDPNAPSVRDIREANARVLASYGHEMGQLVQAMGLMRYREAESFMRGFIPKDSGFPSLGRGGAIWALGWLHEDAADAGLASALRGRLSDLNPMFPEDGLVRSMSAVTLGRMKAKAALSTLEKFYKEEIGTVEIGGMCRWAIMRITGAELPPLPAQVSQATGWFLEPKGGR